LYSSLLTTWHRERDAGVLHALAPQKRGPKSKRDPYCGVGSVSGCCAAFHMAVEERSRSIFLLSKMTKG
jgi:hypothetical protein